MSRHDELIAAYGTPAHFDGFGQPVTYTPDGGAGVSLTAIVGPLSTGEEEDFRGRKNITRREITITTDPAGVWGGVAVPALNARVTIDGDLYEVRSIAGPGTGEICLGLVLIQAAERARPDYRNRRT